MIIPCILRTRKDLNLLHLLSLALQLDVVPLHLRVDINDMTELDANIGAIQGIEPQLDGC